MSKSFDITCDLGNIRICVYRCNRIGVRCDGLVVRGVSYTFSSVFELPVVGNWKLLRTYNDLYVRRQDDWNKLVSDSARAKLCDTVEQAVLAWIKANPVELLRAERAWHIEQCQNTASAVLDAQKALKAAEQAWKDARTRFDEFDTQSGYCVTWNDA
jgi:hypothetical protein